MTQSEKTLKFIEEVKILVDTGAVKNHAEIINAIGWDKTTFSNVINGRKNVPNDVYRKFKEVYPAEDTGQDEIVKNEPLYSLIESNKALAFANKEMAETNKELATMLKAQMSLPSQPSISEQKENDLILEHLAAEGVKNDLWPSKADGLVTLGKLLFSYKRKNALTHR